MNIDELLNLIDEIESIESDSSFDSLNKKNQLTDRLNSLADELFVERKNGIVFKKINSGLVLSNGNPIRTKKDFVDLFFEGYTLADKNIAFEFKSNAFTNTSPTRVNANGIVVLDKDYNIKSVNNAGSFNQLRNMVIVNNSENIDTVYDSVKYTSTYNKAKDQMNNNFGNKDVMYFKAYSINNNIDMAAKELGVSREQWISDYINSFSSDVKVDNKLIINKQFMQNLFDDFINPMYEVQKKVNINKLIVEAERNYLYNKDGSRTKGTSVEQYRAGFNSTYRRDFENILRDNFPSWDSNKINKYIAYTQSVPGKPEHPLFSLFSKVYGYVNEDIVQQTINNNPEFKNKGWTLRSNNPESDIKTSDGKKARKLLNPKSVTVTADYEVIDRNGNPVYIEENGKRLQLVIDGKSGIINPAGRDSWQSNEKEFNNRQKDYAEGRKRLYLYVDSNGLSLLDVENDKGVMVDSKDGSPNCQLVPTKGGTAADVVSKLNKYKVVK
jgi:hypothetical protein